MIAQALNVTINHCLHIVVAVLPPFCQGVTGPVYMLENLLCANTCSDNHCLH